ncbi:MAG: adenylyl-sulfate kinase [Planctomycetota bacterium]
MPYALENIYPIFDQLLGRSEKEALLGQRSKVVWLYGFSGSGKSTLAASLERKLHAESRLCQVLDGDNIRAGLNGDLGFSDADRLENIRRIAEVAKLFASSGAITLASFITPRNELRRLARSVIGDEDLIEVYVKCRFETCQERDVKGLYAKAAAGEVKHFTGKDSAFEEPESPDLVLDTDKETPEESLRRLYEYVAPQIRTATS